MHHTTRHTAALRWRNGNRMMTPIISARGFLLMAAPAHDPAKCERFADKIMR
jgi:hypothetical protein